jgi:hypothetical protein
VYSKAGLILPEELEVFDYDDTKDKRRADWTGLIITAIVSPVFFLSIYLGKPEMGFTLGLILGAGILAMKFQWQHRRHVWFWVTIIVVLALHVPLLFIVRWPESRVPTLAYSLPFGILDFVLITAALNLAEKIFSKSSFKDGDS